MKHPSSLLSTSSFAEKTLCCDISTKVSWWMTSDIKSNHCSWKHAHTRKTADKDFRRVRTCPHNNPNVCACMPTQCDERAGFPVAMPIAGHTNKLSDIPPIDVLQDERCVCCDGLDRLWWPDYRQWGITMGNAIQFDNAATGNGCPFWREGYFDRRSFWGGDKRNGHKPLRSMLVSRPSELTRLLKCVQECTGPL